MPPDSVGMLRGCLLLGVAICPNVVSVVKWHGATVQGYLAYKKQRPLEPYSRSIKCGPCIFQMWTLNVLKLAPLGNPLFPGE